VVALTGDIRRAEDCTRLVAEAAERLGSLQILVNNDGAPPLGRLVDFDDEAWRNAVDQNHLMSVVRLIRAAVPHMRKAGGGSVANITALSMLQPMPDFGLSVAT
jgi:3-oxoacyl-[acyl-carrier protein] reductase